MAIILLKYQSYRIFQCLISMNTQRIKIVAYLSTRLISRPDKILFCHR